MKNKVVFIVLILCLVFSGNVYAGSIKSAKLEKCVDGDTAYFIVDGESYKYRFLAINTPEKKEAYGDVASEVTCNMLTNAKKIEIEIDDKASKTDKYGRSLGWIFVDNQLLQSYLVENGYAKVEYIYGKYKYVNELCKLESEAINKELNIWKNMKTYEGYCNNIEKTKDNTILSSIMKGEYDKAYEELEENPNMIIMVLVLIIIFLLLIIFKKRKSI